MAIVPDSREQATLLRRQQWREYYRAHHVHLAAKQRERYKKNPTPDRMATKQWVANNQEHRRQQQQAWYQRNQLRLRAKHRAYYHANQEHELTRCRTIMPPIGQQFAVGSTAPTTAGKQPPLH